MGWDAWIELDTGGQEPHVIREYDDQGRYLNYTHNTNGMWRSAGLELRDFDGKAAAELILPLSQCLTVMESDPERFRAMEPENGWGSYDGTVDVLRRLLDTCMRHPEGTIRFCF
jgi:hypothetical protein